MPLESLQLDDLTWSDLTKAARDKIASASGAEWTLHAPVDPGITLLELFAAQLDQRLYWMNQTSDEARIALLALLGIRPKPLGVARTVFCALDVESHGTEIQNAIRIEANSVLENTANNSTIRFTTNSDQATQVLPVACSVAQRITQSQKLSKQRSMDLDVRLCVGGKDQTNELRSGALPCLFMANTDNSETGIAINLRHCPKTTAPVSIFFELDTPERIEGQWLAEQNTAGTQESHTTHIDRDIEVPARFSWRYGYVHSVNPFANPKFDFANNVDDGTNGFRRSGVVRFNSLLHAANLPTQQSWFVVVVRVESSSFTFVPRVRRVIPNAVIGQHRVRYANNADILKPISEQIEKWKKRRLPGNRLDLPLAAGDLPIPASVDFRLRVQNDLKERAYHWRSTADFSHQGPSDPCFIVDRDRRALLFGDGLNGRLPVPHNNLTGSNLFHLSFDVGGGSAGNVAANQYWQLSEMGGRQLRVINVVSAQGGEDEETLDQAILRSRSELRRVNRAITKSDIEQLAIQTPAVGIKRAWAAVGLHPEYPCIPTPGAVTVFVVPDLPGSLRRFRLRACGDDLIALKPDAGAIKAVLKHLNAARLVTHEIFVSAPMYEPVHLEVVVTGSPENPDDARETIEQALGQYLHPLYGGPNGDGWPFGNPIRPSELVRVVNCLFDLEMKVKEIGIQKLSVHQNSTSSSCVCLSSHDNLRDLHSESKVSTIEKCNDVPINTNALVALRSIQISFVAPRQLSGGLS